MTDIKALVAQLEATAQRSSDVSRSMAESKSLRQESNEERRTDLYMWSEPEDTLEGKAAQAISTLLSDNARLREAAAKHLEWIDKEREGPDYGDLTRDTHPDGERIWRKWWNEQIDLCGATEELCRQALSPLEGRE